MVPETCLDTEFVALDLGHLPHAFGEAADNVIDAIRGRLLEDLQQVLPEGVLALRQGPLLQVSLVEGPQRLDHVAFGAAGGKFEALEIPVCELLLHHLAHVDLGVVPDDVDRVGGLQVEALAHAVREGVHLVEELRHDAHVDVVVVVALGLGRRVVVRDEEHVRLVAQGDTHVHVPGHGLGLDAGGVAEAALAQGEVPRAVNGVPLDVVIAEERGVGEDRPLTQLVQRVPWVVRQEFLRPDPPALDGSGNEVGGRVREKVLEFVRGYVAVKRGVGELSAPSGRRGLIAPEVLQQAGLLQDRNVVALRLIDVAFEIGSHGPVYATRAV